MILHDVVVYILFFFSSRRRHTRLTCDWSSDVCSSDLGFAAGTGISGHVSLGVGIHRVKRIPGEVAAIEHELREQGPCDRRSEERRVGKSVDLGGCRSIKNKTK